MDIFNAKDVKHRINNIDNIKVFLNLEEDSKSPRAGSFLREMTFLLGLEKLEFYYLLLDLFSDNSKVKLKQERYNESPYPYYEVRIISEDNKLSTLIFIGLDHIIDYLKNVDKYTIIVDKDRIMRKMKKLGKKSKGFIMEAKDFEDLCMSFFINSIRVAKSLSEADLIVANYLYDELKKQILEIARLYVVLTSKGEKDLGDNGEGVKVSLEPDLHQLYLKIFPGGGRDLWDGLFSAVSLFRKIGLALSDLKDRYVYPKKEDIESINYLRFLYNKFGRK